MFGRVLLGPEVRYIISIHIFHMYQCHCGLFQGEGIEGAGIYFSDEIQGKTDDNGYFQLLNVSTGSYNIKVS